MRARRQGIRQSHPGGKPGSASAGFPALEVPFLDRRCVQCRARHGNRNTPACSSQHPAIASRTGSRWSRGNRRHRSPAPRWRCHSRPSAIRPCGSRRTIQVSLIGIGWSADPRCRVPHGSRCRSVRPDCSLRTTLIRARWSGTSGRWRCGSASKSAESMGAHLGRAGASPGR